MSWFSVVVAPVDHGACTLGTLSLPVLPTLVWVLVPAVVVTLGLIALFRRFRDRRRFPSGYRALALLGVFAAGAAAAVPGGVYLGVRALQDWAESDVDRRTSVGGLLLLPGWWIYTDAGRDDAALLRLEGPDGALRLSPMVTSDVVDGLASRLDGETLFRAIDRGLSPPWSERRLALPSALQGVAQRLVEAECAALAAVYGTMLQVVSSAPPPHGLEASSLAAATWFFDTHVPGRAWSLGCRVMGVFIGAAALLLAPLVIAMRRGTRSRQ